MEIHDGNDIMITSRLRLLLPVSLLFFLLLAGCKNAAQPKQDVGFLSIDLVFDFQSDSVIVLFDDQVVFNGMATTNWTVSSARRIRLSVSIGTHHLQVRMPVKSTQRDTSFDMPDTLSFAISYDRTKNAITFALYDYYILFD